MRNHVQPQIEPLPKSFRSFLTFELSPGNLALFRLAGESDSLPASQDSARRLTQFPGSASHSRGIPSHIPYPALINDAHGGSPTPFALLARQPSTRSQERR